MKKRILKTTGLLGIGAITASVAVSCGAEATTDAFGNIWGVSKNDKRIKIDKVSEWQFKDVMSQLKKTDVENSKQITNIFNAAVKYLYRQEQKASEEDKKFREKYIRFQNWSFEEKKIKEKIKSANIKALETEKKIKERVTASFKDSKEAFKSKVGVKWGEEAWGAELARSYDGAKNDEEAINNLIVKEMKSNAYLRFSLSKSTTSFTKGELELGRIDQTGLDSLKNGDKRDKLKAEIAPYFKWLADLDKEKMISSSNKNKTLTQLADGDYITVVSTSSFMPEFKSPSAIIGGDKTPATGANTKGVFDSGYLNKFDPMFISHFLIKAVPDATNKYKPWKISMDDLKKLLYSTDGKTTISENIAGFKGVFNSSKTAGDYKWTVDSKEKKMLELVSGNSGSKTNGGSLGLQDELEYVKGMTSGFAIPILNKDMAGNKLFEESKTITNPIKDLSLKLLESLEKLSNGASTSFANTAAFIAKVNASVGHAPSAIEWQDYVNGLVSTQSEKVILEEAGRVIRDIFGAKGSRYRSAIYDGDNGNKVVLSKFGIHITQTNTIKNVNDGDAKKEIKSMIHSDLDREKDGKTPFFNVLKELNKYSSDQFLVVKSLINKQEFLDFLKTQKNFSADPKTNNKNDFPLYDTSAGSQDLVKINDALKNYKDIFNETRSQEAIRAHRKFIQDSWFKNQMLDPSTKWVKAVNQIYDNALEVSKEGVVK